VGARVGCRARGFGVVGVHGEQSGIGEGGRQRFEHGEDPGRLFFRRHGVGTGTRRLAADIEDIGAVGEQGAAMGDGGPMRAMLSAVVE